MGDQRRDVSTTRIIGIGDFNIELQGNLELDVDLICARFRNEIMSRVQAIRDENPSASVTSKEGEIYVEYISKLPLKITREETDYEYETRVRKEAVIREKDLKVLAELTKKLGVEVVGGIPAAPIVPVPTKIVKPKRVRTRESDGWEV